MCLAWQLMFTQFLNMAISWTHISGHLRCGGIINNNFAANLLLNQPVKEFLKCYSHEFGGLVDWNTVHIGEFVPITCILLSVTVHLPFERLDVPAYKVGLFLKNWGSFDEMAFVMMPVIHINFGGSGTWIANMCIHHPHHWAVVLSAVTGCKPQENWSDISRGSIATRLRCGEIFSDDLIKNLLPGLLLKEFWELVDNFWQN